MIALLLAAALPYGPDRLSNARDVTEVALRPRSSQVAYVTDMTGALEVWIDGKQASWLAEQAGELEWSPDGRSLVFASDYGGDERTDLFQWRDGSVFQLTKSTRAEKSPAFSPDGRRLAYLSDPQAEFVFQLMVRDLETGAERQLTNEAMNVHFPVWSPDGKTIAVTRSGDDQSGPLLLVDVETGKVAEVQAPVKDGILIPHEWVDGALLCTARNEEGFLQLYRLGRGFFGPGDWDVEHVKWPFFTQNVAGASALWKGGKKVLEPRGRIESLDADGGRAAIVRSSSNEPADVWLWDGKLKRVTELSAGVIEPGRLTAGRIISYPSFDGRLIHALYIPAKTRNAPLVINAHGGPDWQSFDDFYPIRQALAEAGFAVLAPNFRGSTGFGWEFLAANRKDWGGGDLKDVIAGVNYLASTGEIDPERVGITGGSYGGYMTLMALTKAPEVFAAGVEAYGMPDLVHDYEIAYTRFKDWYHTQMGNPKDDAALFRDRSAIHFLDRMKAPLLIFQGANDTNVPLAESELIYKALKKRKHDVELVVYPDEGHGFTRRKNKLDYYSRTVEFFKKRLGRAE